MDGMIDEDDFDRLETEEQVAPKLPKTRKSGFGYAMDACGLDTEEAMSFLGLSRSAVEKKRAGSRPMTHDEGRAFSRLWHDIRSGNLEELPEGPRAMAAAMTILTGRKAPEAVRRGRPRMVPVEGAVWTDAASMEKAAAVAMKEAIAELVAQKAKERAERAEVRKRKMAEAIAAAAA